MLRRSQVLIRLLQLVKLERREIQYGLELVRVEGSDDLLKLLLQPDGDTGHDAGMHDDQQQVGVLSSLAKKPIMLITPSVRMSRGSR
jgi:hypothetical protein